MLDEYNNFKRLCIQFSNSREAFEKNSTQARKYNKIIYGYLYEHSYSVFLNVIQLLRLLAETIKLQAQTTLKINKLIINKMIKTEERQTKLNYKGKGKKAK